MLNVQKMYKDFFDFFLFCRTTVDISFCMVTDFFSIPKKIRVIFLFN